MQSVFKRGHNGANFSGMDGTSELFFQDIMHVTDIEICEQGAKSSRVFAPHNSAENIPHLPLEFRADHPFVFLIRDNRTGSILFLGRFCGPEGNAMADEMPRGGGMF